MYIYHLVRIKDKKNPKDLLSYNVTCFSQSFLQYTSNVQRDFDFGIHIDTANNFIYSFLKTTEARVRVVIGVQMLFSITKNILYLY